MFNNGKMCVFIRKDAYDVACNFGFTSEQFRHFMRIHQGVWMDVDTDYLFRDQFNVKTKNGQVVRIPSHYVAMVRNDARIGKKTCMNCGKTSVYKDKLGRIHNTCPNCGCNDSRLLWVLTPQPETHGVSC